MTKIVKFVHAVKVIKLLIKHVLLLPYNIYLLPYYTYSECYYTLEKGLHTQVFFFCCLFLTGNIS